MDEKCIILSNILMIYDYLNIYLNLCILIIKKNVATKSYLHYFRILIITHWQLLHFFNKDKVSILMLSQSIISGCIYFSLIEYCIMVV